jgi:putative Mg2+ transporter-C (MgtC) family protein
MFDYTGNINEVLLRLLVAALLGGLIGLEREFHGRPAGLRTHILVCLGAAVIMDSSLIFQEAFAPKGAESVFRIDPGRIAAGVVTGIGFLGAGAIVRSQDFVRGLTTAACIWFVAAIGIVAGCGLYVPAFIATILGLVVLMGLDPLGHHIPKVKYGQITMTADMTADDIESKCRLILRDFSIAVQNTAVSIDTETGQRTVTLYVRSRRIKNKYEILRKILSLPNVLHISWG